MRNDTSQASRRNVITGIMVYTIAAAVLLVYAGVSSNMVGINALARSYLSRSAGRLVLRVFGGAVLFRGADLTLVWSPLFAIR